MEDIYVVTVGEYSEFSVVCAFSSQEEAQKYVDEMNDRKRTWDPSYRWERVDFNPPIPSVVQEIVQPTVQPTVQHIGEIKEAHIPDGRAYYNLHCSCGYVGGPFWSRESCQRWQEKHEKLYKDLEQKETEVQEILDGD